MRYECNKICLSGILYNSLIQRKIKLNVKLTKFNDLKDRVSNFTILQKVFGHFRSKIRSFSVFGYETIFIFVTSFVSYCVT